MQAGDFTTIVVIFGSFLRPVGGMLADKLGGYRMLLYLADRHRTLPGRGRDRCPPVASRSHCWRWPWHARNGQRIVFQLVPQRFPDSVGIMTGVVGAAGGFGGFMLPSVLGTMKDRTASFGSGS